MGTRKNHLGKAVLTSTHNICFVQAYEKYQNLLSENFPFLVVKFSIYLNGRVFVMKITTGGLKPVSLYMYRQKETRKQSGQTLKKMATMLASLRWK